MTLRIAINGFGRIGRNVLRALYTQGYRQDLQIVAINDLGDSSINAHLLKYDSVMGRLGEDVIVNGLQRIRPGMKVALAALNVGRIGVAAGPLDQDEPRPRRNTLRPQALAISGPHAGRRRTTARRRVRGDILRRRGKENGGATQTGTVDPMPAATGSCFRENLETPRDSTRCECDGGRMRWWVHAVVGATGVEPVTYAL